MYRVSHSVEVESVVRRLAYGCRTITCKLCSEKRQNQVAWQNNELVEEEGACNAQSMQLQSHVICSKYASNL